MNTPSATLLGAATWLTTHGCGTPSDLTPGFERREITVVDTVPNRDATGVSAASSIDLCFSAHLSPSAFTGFEVLLTSGGSAFDTEVEISLFPYREAGSRAELASTRWCEGSVLMVRPVGPLAPGAKYQLRIVAGTYGWNDEEFESGPEGWTIEPNGRLVYTLPFTVDSTPVPDEPLPTPAEITLTDLFDPNGIFDVSTPYCSCHRESGTLAAQRLNLSTPNVAFQDLVGDTSPRSTGFPMVSPGAPAASYLVQKLTDAGGGAPLHGTGAHACRGAGWEGAARLLAEARSEQCAVS